MQMREYGVAEDKADGRDEGGWYKWVDAPEIPAKLKKRMSRCGGCYNAFYNHRSNVDGNTCWSLPVDKNFRGSGRPKCWVHG
jgi:hypothetical protein